MNAVFSILAFKGMLVEGNRESQLSGFRDDGQRGRKNINYSDAIIAVTLIMASNFFAKTMTDLGPWHG